MGRKMDNELFTNKLKKHSIILLQETKNLEEDLKGFVSYRKSRTNDKVDGRSGGVTTLIRKSIKSKLHYSGETDILAVTIGKKETGLEKDLILINFYASPPNSSYSKRLADYDPYEELTRLILSIGSNRFVIVAGDFNARSATKEDRIISGKLDTILGLPSSLSSPELPARANEDSGTSQLTETFMSLLLTTNLVIANGRVKGDKKGSITCTRWNGVSTVDYFITHPVLISQIRSLNIGQHTEFSDHKPLSLELAIGKHLTAGPSNTQNSTMLEKCDNKFVWNPEAKTSYQNILKAESDLAIPALTQLCEEADTSTKCEAICHAVSGIYSTTAVKALTRAKDPPKNVGGTQPWYDGQCRAMKKIMDDKRKEADNQPFNAEARIASNDAKRGYRRCLRSKKANHKKELNEDLEKDGNINWKSLKKLKRADSHEANNKCPQEFFTFFKDLYGKEASIEEGRKELIPQLLKTTLASPAPVTPTNDEEDDESFEVSLEDLNGVIKSTKTGKAAGIDEISNDMIKCSNKELKNLLVKTFNCCIKTCCFPWKESVIIPIHKKGPTADPDMYRPIALSSCLGKVFSQLILKEFQAERAAKCPETINQAGFCKGAMTADHILTIQTVVEKYKKLKKPIYGAFIDFRKAFDLVWRDGLMLKLAEMGLKKPLLKIIMEYYKGRTARLKMDGALTEAFQTILGVIQGEPPSPELFKAYIHKLSELLDEVEDLPELNKIILSHLLWADDLYVNALTPEGLQKLLDILSKYCNEWGLIPNAAKCNILIFNGNEDDKTLVFKIGEDTISHTDSYTYLGLELTRDGKLNTAARTLAAKGKRAMGSLMGSIDKTIVKPEMSLKLFNSLVKPILLYGSQIWLPLLAPKQVIGLSTPNLATFFNSHAECGGERVHLRFLKWILGVNKKTTNVFTWGELGEVPLLFSALDQAVSYYKRVSAAPAGSLLYNTIQEQKRHGLKWWVTMSGVENSSIQELKKQFMGLCDTYKLCHSKTQFLASSNTKFGMQRYIQVVDSFQSRRTWAKLRGSASCLAIETGRYQQPPIEPDKRYCPLCQDMGLLEVEDEQHFLGRCPVLQEARQPMIELLQGQTINGETISNTTDKGKLNTMLNTIYRMYTIRAKPKETQLTVEGMAVDFLLNNWIPSDTEYYVSMTTFLPRNPAS